MTEDLKILEAQWAAEDALEAATTKAKNDYYRFYEAAQSVDENLVDEGCDQENTVSSYGTLAFWEEMLSSAKIAAQYRSENYGININSLR